MASVRKYCKCVRRWENGRVKKKKEHCLERRSGMKGWVICRKRRAVVSVTSWSVWTRGVETHITVATFMCCK